MLAVSFFAIRYEDRFRRFLAGLGTIFRCDFDGLGDSARHLTSVGNVVVYARYNGRGRAIKRPIFALLAVQAGVGMALALRGVS
jgi:hypothetical protein